MELEKLPWDGDPWGLHWEPFLSQHELGKALKSKTQVTIFVPPFTIISYLSMSNQSYSLETD